jgi:putative flippase GtrA
MKKIKKQFLRYIVAAGSGMTVDLIAYTLLYHFILYHLHIPSFIISFSLGLITNFAVSKFFVFSESELSTQTQFKRFFIISIVVFFANLGFMQLLYIQLPKISEAIPKIPFYGGFVRLLAGGTIAIISFLSHKFLSFEA